MSFNNLDIDIEEALYRGFNKFIKSFLTEEDVFLGSTDFSPPKGPYTVVVMEQVDPVSWSSGAEFSEFNSTTFEIETSTFSTYMATISIMCYGKGSFSKAVGITNAFRDKSLCQLLSHNGIGYSSNSTVYDVSRSMDNSSTERAAMFTVRVYFVLGGKDRGQFNTIVESVEGVEGTYNP